MRDPSGVSSDELNPTPYPSININSNQTNSNQYPSINNNINYPTSAEVANSFTFKQNNRLCLFLQSRVKSIAQCNIQQFNARHLKQIHYKNSTTQDHEESRAEELDEQPRKRHKPHGRYEPCIADMYNSLMFAAIRDGITTDAEGEVAALTVEEKQMLQHRRAGHLSHSTLRVTHARGFDYLKDHYGFCDSCPAGNSKATSRKVKRTRETELLGLVHMDLWGPAQVRGARDKCNYVVAFIDDASRLVAAYRIKKKSDTLAAYIEFKKRHAKPLKLDVQRIQTDNGTESMGDFLKYVENDGTVVQRSAPYSQNQNSVVERMFGTLFGMVRKMLADPQLPAKYWDYALAAAVWIKNRTATRSLQNGITPFEVFWKKKPDLSYLRVFGSPCYVHVDASLRQKLDSRVIKCLFIGYSDNHKAWKCLDLKTGRELITITASFNERLSDKTPSLTLLQQPQPADLQLELLEDKYLKVPVTNCDSEMFQTPEKKKAEEPKKSPEEKKAAVPKQTLKPRGIKLWTPIAGEPNEGELDEKFYRLPSDMNLVELADHFGVDSHDYSRFIRKFKPFGDGEKWRQPLLPHKLTRSTFRFLKLGKLCKGTDVPSPVGSHLFGEEDDEPFSFNDVEVGVFGITDDDNECSTEMLQDELAAISHSCLEQHFGLHSMDTPTSFKQAVTGPESAAWKKSMTREIDELIKNGTWKMVDKPDGAFVVNSKWVYRIKELSDGTVDRLKSRLVAMGNTQTKGVNYDLIFSPVVRFATVRMVIAIAAMNDWELHQMDVSNAFTTCDLVEDDPIFLRVPQGYAEFTGASQADLKPNGYLKSGEFGSNRAEKVLELKKSLYGLKQAGRNFNESINKFLTENQQLTRSGSDYCLYSKTTSEGTLIIALYCDDLIIVCSSVKMLNDFKAAISDEKNGGYKMTDLGEMKWCLGMEIIRDREAGTIKVSQAKYIRDLVKAVGMEYAGTAPTPFEPKQRFTADSIPTSDASRADLTRYRELVGKLIYAMIGTRADIAWSVSQVSRFFSNPSVRHMGAAKRIVRYLAGTADRGIVYRRGKERGLVGWCDADWAGDRDDRRSTSGWVVQLAGGAVSWFSKRQPVVALSSAESEYICACSCAQEIMFFRQALSGIGFNVGGRTTVWCDSQSAMAMTENPTNGRAKHIDIKFHYVKDCVSSGNIKFKYVGTSDQIADLMTKGLGKILTLKFTDQIMGVGYYMEISMAKWQW